MLFNQIYNLYYIKIYQFIFRLSLSKEESEDIIQDIFMSLHTELKKGNTPNNIKAWLYKCALNKFINGKRRGKIMQFTDNIGQFDFGVTHSFENEFLQNEKKKIITNALSKLSSNEQILLNLYNDEFSYKEISDILEIKLTSVGKTLSRVIEKLANQIKLINHEELYRERKII